jgi:hypothetical protein
MGRATSFQNFFLQTKNQEVRRPKVLKSTYLQLLDSQQNNVSSFQAAETDRFSFLTQHNKLVM